MTKFRLFLSIMLSAILIITGSPIAFAQDFEEPTSESIICEDENHTHESSIVSPRYVCHICGSSAALVCAGDKVELETGTHWSLRGTCTVSYQCSTSAHICRNPSCAEVLVIYGYHDCVQVHSTCSKGNYNVCTVASDIS